MIHRVSDTKICTLGQPTTRKDGVMSQAEWGKMGEGGVSGRMCRQGSLDREWWGGVSYGVERHVARRSVVRHVVKYMVKGGEVRQAVIRCGVVRRGTVAKRGVVE